ncbi:MAG: hypothetical protein H7Y11_14140, partial [Armatimonadetes bacterium]|nr:hypothetical protein [Anaerolineae bacterium]
MPDNSSTQDTEPMPVQPDMVLPQLTPDDGASALTEDFSEVTTALVMPARVDAPMLRRVIDALNDSNKPEPVQLELDNTPWTLQQFFNGDIDLEQELAQRFQNMPVMSIVHFRSMGTKSKRGVATLTAQDGAAQVIIDVDAATKMVQVAFTFGSMLTLRFKLDQLGDVDRARWLELMQRKEGGMSFLWGPSRWEHDYMICVVRRYSTNLYAFSPNNFEAAIRMTPDVMRSVLKWLAEYWKPAPPKDAPSPLLT